MCDGAAFGCATAVSVSEPATCYGEAKNTPVWLRHTQFFCYEQAVLLSFDRYVLDPINRELRCSDELVKIDPQQFDLLSLFLHHPGELLSRQQIMDSVWQGRLTAESALSVAVAKLRKVLGRTRDGRDFVENRYGRGYRFLLEVSVPAVERHAKVASAPAQLTAARDRLVGRAAQLLRLIAAASQVRAGGSGGLMLICGEPGIGKTRLAEALEQAIEGQPESPLVVWARCQAEASTPLWPVRQIMQALARDGLVNAESLPPLAAASQSSLAAAPAASFEVASERYFSALKSGAGIDHGTLDALAHRLIDASRRRALLIIVDDIQWADSASLRVLTYVTDAVQRAPLLLVCGLRSGGMALWDQGHAGQRELSNLWNHRNCQRLDLGRLNARDVTEYVQAHVGESTVDVTEVSRVLFARSEGNPFFMVDLLRTLDSANTQNGLVLQPSRMALEALRGRLADLPAPQRAALSAAAVIGHDFDLGLVSFMTDSPPAALLGMFDAPIVRQRPHSVAGVFSFEHELIRELLYHELLPQERSELHLRAAEALLRRRAGGGEVTDAELAHHFLDAQPCGDVEVAIAYAQSAAAEASRLAAHADVRALLARALDVLRFHVAPQPHIRAALLLQQAMVERIQGDAAYSSHVTTAVAIAREHRLGRLLATAGQLLSVSPGVASPAEAGAVLQAANELLASDDFENLAIVRAQLAWATPASRSARCVERLCEEARDFADRSRSSTARAALNDTLLYFSGGPDSFERAEQISLDIERQCAEQPDIATHVRESYVARARLVRAMQQGNRQALSLAIDARSALVSRLRNAELTWHHDRMLLVKAMNEGSFARINVDLTALRERARRLELHAAQLLSRLDYSVFLCRTTDVSGLASRVRTSLAPAEHDSAHVRAGKIRSMVEFGLVEEAATAMEPFSVTALDDLPRDQGYLAVLCHLSVGAVAAESREQCEALLRLLGPYGELYAASASYHCEGSVASHSGMLCEALGQHEHARKHYTFGLEREQAFGLMPAAAMTGFRLARLLLRERLAHDDGASLVEYVRSEALRMGMEPLQRAAIELSRNFSLRAQSLTL